jgi:hypothetical protein
MIFIFTWLLYALTIFIAYLVFYLVLPQYYMKWYYERQGIKCCKGYLPLLGHTARILSLMKKDLKGL